MKKGKAFKRLICIIAFAVVFWILGFISMGENVILIDSVFALIIICVGFLTFYFENRSDKLRKEYESQNKTQFSDRYYRFREKYDYEYPVKKTMISDLKKRYINRFNIEMIISGILISLIYFSACLIWNDLFNFKLCVITAIVAISCITEGLVLCSANPVKKFAKKYRAFLPKIEKSYLSGTMVINNQVGINIGNEYIVIYSPKEVAVINTNAVINAEVSCNHEKEIQDGIYFGSNFRFFIQIITSNTLYPPKIELGEFKCEMVRDELKRRGIINAGIDNDTNFEQSEKISVSTLY